MVRQGECRGLLGFDSSCDINPPFDHFRRPIVIFSAAMKQATLFSTKFFQPKRSENRNQIQTAKESAESKAAETGFERAKRSSATATPPPLPAPVAEPPPSPSIIPSQLSGVKRKMEEIQKYKRGTTLFFAPFGSETCQAIPYLWKIKKIYFLLLNWDVILMLARFRPSGEGRRAFAEAASSRLGTASSRPLDRQGRADDARRSVL